MNALLLVAALTPLSTGLSAAATSDAVLAVCTQHLQAIGRALAAYQRDHGELPSHLSDLYPKYVTETEVFHCPADASPGSTGEGEWDDPKLPVSYSYLMVASKAWPNLPYQLGPQKLGREATWRDFTMALRVHFGESVQVVTCGHHRGSAGVSLRLTLSGQIYRDPGNPFLQPRSVVAMLQRMQHDIAGGPTELTRNWALPAVEDYSSQWINTSLPPGIRCRLGSAADRLSSVAEALPTAAQSDAFTVAAEFYRGAGQTKRAIVAAEAALAHPGNHKRAAPLLAELRYTKGRKPATPPVDTYIEAELARQHCPSMALAVVRGGKVLLARGYGLANLERSVPATKDTVYAICSMTKSFTATGIMMLVEKGKVALDDRISRYLPDIPATWNEIKIRHLLTHTSGLPLDIDVAKGPLLFSPGEQQSYSNAGYVLLGRIIEWVSGQPLQVFLDQHIFRPLRMTSTAAIGDLDIMAQGYSVSTDDGTAKRVDPIAAAGSGGFASTVMDLARWDAALYTEKLLKKSTLERMWTPGRLNSGRTFGYGFGWEVGSYLGHKEIGHSGGAPGWTTYMVRFVDDRLTVILLTNEAQDARGVAHHVAMFYLPPAAPIAERDPQTTRRLKRVLLRLAKAETDAAQFTAETHAVLVAELEQASAFYRSLGPMKSFRLIELGNEAGKRTCRYRMAFRDTTWIQTFVLNDEGRIAELSVEPD